MEQSNTDSSTENCNISGQLSKKRTVPFLKVLFTVTGLTLIIGLFGLISRYLLTLRKNATASLKNGILTIQVTYTIFGKRIKHTQTTTAVSNIRTIQLENRSRYIHLLVGFGFLVSGLFCGIHWLLDGLGAGYPYLALIGAGVILAGIAADLVLYHFIPDSPGSTNVAVDIPGWKFRVLGVSQNDAAQFVQCATARFTTRPPQTNDPAA